MFIVAPDFIVPVLFGGGGTKPTNNRTSPETLTHLQLVQKCMAQDTTKQPVIIDTDSYVDDLWGIHYLINVINMFSYLTNMTFIN